MKQNCKLFIFIVLIILNGQVFADNQGLLNVHKYLQCGQSWSGNTIGSCTGNMCQLGCAVTCMAMLLKSNGANVDPGTLNSFLKLNNNQGYQDGCFIRWNVASTYPGSTMSYVSYQSYSLTTIKSRIDMNDPVIVEVDLPNTSLQHFVVVRGYTGNGNTESDFKVYDPLEVNEKLLSQYVRVSMRIFNNVMQSGSVSVTFKFNGSNLQPPPNEWKLWKAPEVSENFYTLNVIVTNRPGNATWNLYVVRPDGQQTDAALNVSGDVISQLFYIYTHETWYHQFTAGYKLKVTRNSNPNETWGTSEPFYISKVPDLTVSNMPNVLYVGDNATFSWSISGGIPTLPNGGWTGNIQIQWHQDSALNVLSMEPVNSSPFPFIVPPKIVGGSIPGSGFKLSGSNPPGSSIPPGSVYAFTNSFSILNSTSIIKIDDLVPELFELYVSFPNPFNPITNIKFDIPKNDNVKLIVYNAMGQEIAILVDQYIQSGSYEYSWDATNYPSGTYFYTLKSDNFSKTRKMILIK